MSDDRTTLRREPPSTRAPQPSLLLYHRDGVKVVPLPVGASVVVGRSYPSDAVLDDRSLSRQHARFESTPEAITVTDLESTNGTWVNGERVTTARVGAADVIRVGDVVVSLHVVQARGAAGLEGHEQLVTALCDEVKRTHTFGRPVSLVMLRKSGPDAHVSRWTPALAAALRAADRVGLYAEDTALVLLPEMGRPEVVDRARELADLAGGARAGLAVFPDDAGSAEELIGAARSSLARGLGAAATASSLPPSTVVRSAPMRAVYDEVSRVAGSTLPVLVVGETGTGKELVARAIHDKSPRRAAPLRSINCGAIPATLVEGMLFGHERGAFTSADRAQKGLFQQAHGGTVFLDEIGELSPTAQAALLRVLETKKLTRIGGEREIDVDVRVVAATHRDLEAMCDLGTFRRDLLYRLNAVVLELPALRERTDEIDPLAQTFLAEANASSGRQVRGFDRAAQELLARYGWPGNVRELKNVVERAVVLARGDWISPLDLPPRIRGEARATQTSVPPRDSTADSPDLDFKERIKQQTRAYEIEIIREALRRASGNQTEAAKLLKMPVRTLTHKMKELGIKKSFG